MLEKRLIELLTRKMAGELSSTELLELNDILLSYPEALQEEEIFKKIWDFRPEEEDIALFYERHKNEYKNALVFAEEKHSIPVSKTRLIKYRLFSVASILAIIVIVGIFGYKNSFSKDSFKQIIAEKGVRKMLTLPDGTKVWLNADSRLSYDPEMTGANQRLVTLTGEAFFDVAHDKQHPFIINANKVTIKVLGTAFNVKAYPGDAKCETTLIRGSVELTINNGSKQKFILKPSEKIALIDEEDEKYEEGNEHSGKGRH
jgi:ferric-dicitrate binding protein FerR (iron transport regulator)